MTLIRFSLLGLGLLAMPALAAAPEATGASVTVKKVEPRELVKSLSDKIVEGATPETEAILASCSAMKFETSVIVGTGTAARVTKVKMCSRAGDTKEQWIVSLTDAVAKIEANLELAPDSRVKLVAAIQAEIARLKS